jgi:hypothetical protein
MQDALPDIRATIFCGSFAHRDAPVDEGLGRAETPRQPGRFEQGRRRRLSGAVAGHRVHGFALVLRADLSHGSERPAGHAGAPTPSFPAGHTAAALALHGAAALLIVRRARRRPPWLLLLVPAAIGVARLYRGLHHPSDAVAGALLGAMCVAAAQLEAARVGGLPPARTDPGT